MTSVSNQLLERQAELTVLDDCFASAAVGEGRLVVISGEAGVGRTALARDISPKTVDHHVSSVLSKLGVSSRREAARRVEELGVTPAVVA